MSRNELGGGCMDVDDVSKKKTSSAGDFKCLEVGVEGTKERSFGKHDTSEGNTFVHSPTWKGRR